MDGLHFRLHNRVEVPQLLGFRRISMAAKSNPFTFLQQVRSEVSKVTWPSRRETIITSIWVVVMVFLAALFFFLVDQGLGYVVGELLSFGS